MMYAAVGFKDEDLIWKIYVFREQFENTTGMMTWPDADQRVRELRRGGGKRPRGTDGDE